jgi:archaetidylinositol phosphate synthase
MTVSTDEAAVRPAAAGEKDRPAREVVVSAFFGPLAHRLALALRPLRVPAPAVVLANGVAGVAAAVAIEQGSLVAAAILLQLKTLLDNADGRLARVSGRVTRLGRFLDTDVDLLVNVAVFTALGSVTGRPWLALAAFLALTIVLSVNFNASELYREAHGRPTILPAPTGSPAERAVEGFYRVVFGWQDRAVHGFVARRIDRLAAAEPDRRRQHATRAYHDYATMAILANLGLSTQLAVLGACLVLDAPLVYLWFVLAAAALLPVLALRRERLVRQALSAPRAT